MARPAKPASIGAGLIGVLVAMAAYVWPSLPARAQDSATGQAPVVSQKKPASEGGRAADLPADTNDIRVRSELVITPVTVTDRSGEFIYGLEEGDFEVLDNGAPQKIRNFEDEEARPVAVVIVIQTSSAVGPLLDQLRPLGSVLSALLIGGEGHAAVVTYDDRVRVEQDFSADSEQLAKTLQDLAVHGDQARLNDALERAAALLERRPRSERRVILAFSDGADHGSETAKETVLRRATGVEATIYGLRFHPAQARLKQKPQAPAPNPLDTNVARPTPPGKPATPSESQGEYGSGVPAVPLILATGQMIRSSRVKTLLELYCGYTGGAFYSHWTEKALQEQLSRIASEVHTQYELAYVPSNSGQAEFHRIQVRVKRPGVKVRARAGYFAPPVKR